MVAHGIAELIWRENVKGDRCIRRRVLDDVMRLGFRVWVLGLGLLGFRV